MAKTNGNAEAGDRTEGDAPLIDLNEGTLKKLIARNSGYGSAVRDALEKRADLLHVHYAYVLRTVNEKDAWTIADRKGFYEWLGRVVVS